VVTTRRPSSGLSQTPSQGAGLRLAERSGPAAAPFFGHHREEGVDAGEQVWLLPSLVAPVVDTAKAAMERIGPLKDVLDELTGRPDVSWWSRWSWRRLT
jgi:hypothetical protein